MQIGSIFLPVIQRYTDALQRVVQWFRNLSGEQQQQIMRWSLFTTGVLGSVTVVPRLTAALGTLGMTLKGLAIANPTAALTAAVVGLLAQTERGRDSLASMGQALASAFGTVSDVLGGPLAAGLQGLADFVASGPGQWLAFGTVAVSVLYRIAAAGQGAATAFLGWGTALGAALLVIGGIITALGRAEDAGRKTVEQIAAGVRAGTVSEAEARERIRIQAELAGFEKEREAERLKKEGPGLGGVFGLVKSSAEALDPVAAGREERDRLIRQGEEALERARKGRSDLTRSAGGVEDPRATIRRLEAASLKTSGQEPASDKTLREILEIVRRALGYLPFGQKPQVPPPPVKAD